MSNERALNKWEPIPGWIGMDGKPTAWWRNMDDWQEPSRERIMEIVRSALTTGKQ